MTVCLDIFYPIKSVRVLYFMTNQPAWKMSNLVLSFQIHRVLLYNEKMENRKRDPPNKSLLCRTGGN